MRIFTCCGSGVMALAITPPGVFGYLRVVQGFKPRFETVLWLELVRIAGEIFSSPETVNHRILFLKAQKNLIHLGRCMRKTIVGFVLVKL